MSLSHGELYTFVSSRDAKGRKGKLVAVIASTKASELTQVLMKIPEAIRKTVTEVSMDMAPAMSNACLKAFYNADQVIDRFHVLRLPADAMQHIRVEQRWQEMDKENTAIKEAKAKKVPYDPVILSNGDTPKQLLARSRHLLYKWPYQWTYNQRTRAVLLFQRYPKIEHAYRLNHDFRKLYEQEGVDKAKGLFDSWVKKVEDSKIDHFNSAAKSIANHLEGILNFFKNRSTNAHAESLNAQIKLFRANLRGVKNISMFLFRLEKIFA